MPLPKSGTINAFPTVELPERQIADLPFPFAGIATFRQQNNVLDRRSDWNAAADFEYARHAVALHDAAIGVRRYGRNIVSKEHSIPLQPTPKRVRLQCRSTRRPALARYPYSGLRERARGEYRY